MTALHRMVAEQAVRTPDRVAVEHSEEQLSYSQLIVLSRRLAGELADGDVGAGDVVAVATPPSIDSIVALLGILEVGATYLPIDTATPPARMELMLRDSAAAAVVLSSRTPVALPAHAPRTFRVPRPAESDPTEDGDGRSTACDPSSLAYVIYTSGSTGTPKGVGVTHRNAVNLIASMATRLRTQAHDRVLQTAALAFDASVEEIFATLARGATLVICPAWLLASTKHLLEVCDSAEISVLNLPTPLLHTLALDMADDPSLELPRSVKLIVTGGERLRPELARVLLERIDRDVSLLDMYGPTETTVTALVADVRNDWRWDDGDPLPSLGSAIPNVVVTVCDDDLRPVPVGESGELVVGGAGVAAGYVGHAAGGATGFVDDPHHPGQRVYRTGDYAERCEDGRLRFLGRKDDQVKIRGFRIEIGEVEASLNRLDQIREAAVGVSEDGVRQAELVAYITTRGPAPSIFDLRADLATSLPAYMIPTRFVQVREIPRLPNGKTDRAGLPGLTAAAEPATGDDHDAAPLTREVSQIFADVLDRSAIGSGENFFHLGGHSLSAMRVIARIGKSYEVDLPPDALAWWPTARELADAVESKLREGAVR